MVELRHGSRERARDSRRELSVEVDSLQRGIVERDRAIDWAINSRSIAWDCEATARAQVEELSVALKICKRIIILCTRKCTCCMASYIRTFHQRLRRWELVHQEQLAEDLMGSWISLEPLLP
jgi:hypothetical protein